MIKQTTNKVMEVLNHYLLEIVKASGLRDANEIFVFIIDSGYEILPFPIRMVIKKDTFVKVITEGKEKVLGLISKILDK